VLVVDSLGETCTTSHRRRVPHRGPGPVPGRRDDQRPSLARLRLRRGDHAPGLAAWRRGRHRDGPGRARRPGPVP
jgi:hypothetical protein